MVSTIVDGFVYKCRMNPDRTNFTKLRSYPAKRLEINDLIG